MKIIKNINNNNENENQIIKNAHNYSITKIIELKNENLITFSLDCSFKIWKLNNNNNKYEIINEFKDTNELSDGLEIKDNEIIFYSVYSKPNSLVFYDLNKNKKIKTLNNLNLSIDIHGEKTNKLNDDEIVVAGNKKVYLIDFNNYEILHEINTNFYNCSILKLSNNLFLVGDENGNITQYKIENKKIIKESSKLKSHDKWIFSIVITNDMIISGNGNNIDIKIWKN